METLVETLTLLKNARELISNEENWTYGSYSRSIDGGTAIPSSTDAVCWCSIGALRKFGAWDSVNDAMFELMVAMPEDYRQSVATFNDSHTHAEVLALFDKAIANMSLK